jgi:hypothetical protein
MNEEHFYTLNLAHPITINCDSSSDDDENNNNNDGADNEGSVSEIDKNTAVIVCTPTGSLTQQFSILAEEEEKRDRDNSSCCDSSSSSSINIIDPKVKEEEEEKSRGRDRSQQSRLTDSEMM